MNEFDLKKKLQEWLGIKREADTLEKAREDKGVHPGARKEFRDQKRSIEPHNELEHQVSSSAAPGVSHAGIEARRADQKSPGVVSHGYARVGDPSMHKEKAKSEHKRILDHIKSTHPDLPKSELDKADQKGIHSASMSSSTGGSSSAGNMAIAGKHLKAPHLTENAKGQHRQIISELKSMPKPNLPKSELDKASISMPMGGGMRMSGINIGQIGVTDPTKKKKPKSSSTVVTSTMGTSGATSSGAGGAAGLASSEKPVEKGDLGTATGGQSDLAQGIGATAQGGGNQQVNFPNPFGKAEEKPQHEDIVAGVKVPKELHQHSGPVPYDHPHRELAAKFVTDVWRKNRAEGMRMSDKHLGIGQGLVAGQPPKTHRETYARMDKPTKKSEKVIPADVSDPIIENRVDSEHPKEINGPNIINAYKSEGTEATGNLMLVSDIVNILKRKKYGP